MLLSKLSALPVAASRKRALQTNLRKHVFIGWRSHSHIGESKSFLLRRAAQRPEKAEWELIRKVAAQQIIMRQRRAAESAL